MKKPSDVFKNIRFAKLDPKHDKGPKGSTDDEEHGAVSEVEWNQQLAHQKKRAMQEDLRQWFDKDHPKGGWKRINSKGEAIGPCAREPGEPKPKCMSNEKRAKLSKTERASAVAAKRKHDPNPERKGEPINVSNFGKGKISEDMENLEEKNVPTSPEKWAQAKAQAKAKFDVYPSAYANGWAAKKYKEMGGGWKSVSEAVKDKFDIGEYDQEGDMAKSDLRSIMANAKKMHDMIEDSDNLPEWVQSKITKAEDYISTVANYMTAEMNEEIVVEEDIKSARIIKSLYKKKGVMKEEITIEEEIAGWIAHYNGQKHEIKKHEAKDLYDAKQKAIAHFKAPKSKHGLIAVKPAYNEAVETQPKSDHEKWKEEYKKARAAGSSSSNAKARANGAVYEEEQLDELSNETLKSYRVKSIGRAGEFENRGYESAKRGGAGSDKADKLFNKADAVTTARKRAQEKMREETELDEGKMKDIATNAAEDKRLGSWRKETPWMKVKDTVTDKSGAKHTPMSRARDLARKAAQKNVKESFVAESRLADIVKEAAEKAKKKKKEKEEANDTFQKDPELSTQIIRND